MPDSTALPRGRRPMKPDTPKQREAKQLLLEGKTNAEIAAAMGISLKGAKFHIYRLYQKHGVRTRAQFIIKAYEEILRNVDAIK